MKPLNELKVKIFADGDDLKVISNLSRNPLIKGFTTNPSLMRKAGISDYRAFAREVLNVVCGRPISLEVFSAERAEREQQAREIAAWGKYVYANIRVTNPRRAFVRQLLQRQPQSGRQR